MICKTNRYYILFSVIVLLLGAAYAFRKSDQAKLIGIKIFGDRALKRTMDEFKVKFIPQLSIKYKRGTLGTTNIYPTWIFRQEYAIDTYPVPVVDDADHDGKPEVYIGSHSREIDVLDGKTGGMLWTWKLPFGVVGGRVVNLVDLDGDGKKELVFGSHTTLPIRVYALKTGIIDPSERLFWKKNLSGDFFEGGINIIPGKTPLIVASTRDAPYSRGTFSVIKSDGTLLYPSIEGVDDCISRPAVGNLPADKNLAVIHGSHNYYNATFAHKIVARDLQTGKVLWESPKIGDTGFQNHQIVDIDFDGQNEVLAFAIGKDKKMHQYILNGVRGSIIREVPWYVQGVLKEKKELLVCQIDSTKCLSQTGRVLYSIPKISFGIKEQNDSLSLFSFRYVKDSLIIKKIDANNGRIIKVYSCLLMLPVYKKPGDSGTSMPNNAVNFLTLADTDNDSNWDCLIQIRDFVVNVKMPIKIRTGTNQYAPISFRNIDNGGVIY